MHGLGETGICKREYESYSTQPQMNLRVWHSTSLSIQGPERPQPEILYNSGRLAGIPEVEWAERSRCAGEALLDPLGEATWIVSGPRSLALVLFTSTTIVC